MKILTITILFIHLNWQKAIGQNLHAFLFCKTLDKTIGNSVRINYVNIREQFQMIANVLNIQYIEHSITGLQYTVENINRAVNEAKIDNNDIVVIYFSSHGAISELDTVIFPQITVRNEFISAYNLHKRVGLKNSKMLLTIIEACSGYADITPQVAFIFEQFDGGQVVDELNTTQINNIRRLFSATCNLIITAGNPGKNTWATSEGSMFTNCFLRSMNEHFNESANQAGVVTWDHLLEQAKQYTEDMTKTTDITYYPVWEKSLCDSNTVSSTIDSSGLEKRDVSFGTTLKRRYWDLRRPYSCRFWVKNKSGKEIDSVVYFLDKTMKNPIVTKDNKNENFLLILQVWGFFPVKAKVYFADRKVIDLYKHVELSNNSKKKSSKISKGRYSLAF